jgi:hypothetical protein
VVALGKLYGCELRGGEYSVNVRHSVNNGRHSAAVYEGLPQLLHRLKGAVTLGGDIGAGIPSTTIPYFARLNARPATSTGHNARLAACPFAFDFYVGVSAKRARL